MYKNKYLKIAYILAYLLSYTYAAMPKSFETIVVYSTQNKQQAKAKLLTLKTYLQERGVPDSLNFTIEKLDDFYTIVIKPILNQQQRNDLLLLLQSRFPDSFYIKEKYIQNPRTVSLTPTDIVHNQPTKTNKTPLIKSTDWIWFSIWILAVIGLIASIRNRYRMKHLSHQQKEMHSKQKQIENEIQQLGDSNV